MYRPCSSIAEMTLLEQMARAYETWMPLQLRKWYSADERRELAMEKMRPQAEHTADTEFGAGFRDHLQPLGGPDVPDPLAWANRRVEFADGNWCIAGIRFLGLDRRKPFVHVVATSAPPQHDRLGTYAKQLHSEFADFGPRQRRKAAARSTHLDGGRDPGAAAELR